MCNRKSVFRFLSVVIQLRFNLKNHISMNLWTIISRFVGEQNFKNARFCLFCIVFGGKRDKEFNVHEKFLENCDDVLHLPLAYV